MDPISENMAVLTGDPVKAFEHQDHQSHIQVHMLGMQDPKVQSMLADSPMAQASAAAMMAHITEHVAWDYRQQMQEVYGGQLPPAGEPLPPELEVELSRLVAQASGKLFEKNTAEKVLAENEQALMDPMLQIRLRELDLEEVEVQGKLALQDARLKLDQAKLVQKDEAEDEDRLQQAISNTERVTGTLLGEIVRAASETEALTSKERLFLVEQMISRVKEGAAEIRQGRASQESGKDGGE